MQRQALQVVSMRDASEDGVRNAGVDEIQVGEVFDGDRLESGIPRMLALKVCAKNEVAERVLIFVQYCPHFAHVGEAIVILRAKSKLAEVPNADTPTASKCQPLGSNKSNGCIYGSENKYVH